MLGGESTDSKLVNTEYSDYQERKDHFEAAFMHRSGHGSVVYK